MADEARIDGEGKWGFRPFTVELKKYSLDIISRNAIVSHLIIPQTVSRWFSVDHLLIYRTYITCRLAPSALLLRCSDLRHLP